MQKSGSSARRLFVMGTDTGVGKTVISLLLMQFFYRRGHDPFYVKLIQTGCASAYDTESDARFIYDHVPALKGKDPGDSVVYCLKNPKAPYFAARDEGVVIDPHILKESFEQRIGRRSPVILEGAGGLLVPVTADVLMISLVELLAADPVLVARAGLGTINHTLLSIEALRTRGMEPAGVVLVDSGKTPTPHEMIRENMEAVASVAKVRVAGVVGRIRDFLNPDDGCYGPLSELLDQN
jgi:dethiobiotin synthetase